MEGSQYWTGLDTNRVHEDIQKPEGGMQENPGLSSVTDCDAQCFFMETVYCLCSIYLI